MTSDRKKTVHPHLADFPAGSDVLDTRQRLCPIDEVFVRKQGTFF
jgi:hypothetical protein